MADYKFGLVTVLYNSETVLEDFYRSLDVQTCKDYRLYVIENDSSDNSLALSEELAAKYNIDAVHIDNGANVGIAKGNNQGIELSLKDNCEYTILLNNDTVFDEPSMLQGMYDKVTKENIKMLVPKTMCHGTNKIWAAGGDLSIRTGRVTHFGEFQEDGPEFNSEKEVIFAPTCFMIIHNDLFKEIGMMDERYFVYYDDTDFVYRCINKGYRIVYAPQFTVDHKVSISTGGPESTFSVYYYNRNRFMFIKKNFTFPHKQIAFTFSFITRLIKYSAKGRFPEIYKAMKDGILFKM